MWKQEVTICYIVVIISNTIDTYYSPTPIYRTTTFIIIVFIYMSSPIYTPTPSSLTFTSSSSQETMPFTVLKPLFSHIYINISYETMGKCRE